MALNDKYTWGDFLKAHPEVKKKKVKRTSPEGEKAFKAAFKIFAKEFLKQRVAKLKKEEDRVAKLHKELVGALKSVDGKKWHLKSKRLNQQIGRLDAYTAKLKAAEKRTAELTKKI